MKRIGDKIEFESPSDYPPMVVSFGSMRVNKTGSWRYIRPLYQNKTPPCTPGCPAGEKIPQYFALVKEGKFFQAWELIKEDNPFPATCGRVCYHPCEGVCNRANFDEAIAIHMMERFVADKGYEIQNLKLKTQNSKVKVQKEKVAIIGSGPAGLSCAYFLARLGYSSVIFEALQKPGGMLRVGIPEYRLPKDVLDREIDNILSLGCVLETGAKLGESLRWGDLRRFQAVFIGPGAHKGRKMGIPGEDLSGLYSGLEFLKEINLKKKKKITGKVAIVGGGNTAIDTARSVLRLGAKPVILYRRTKAEMPAHPEEVSEAEKEGVEIQYLTAPTKVVKYGDRFIIECQKMKLGEPDSSGRRAPVPIRGSKFQIRVDYLMPAIGEEPEISFLSEKIELKGGNRILLDVNGMTTLRGIFAGGDAATGPIGTVVDAIASGKRAGNSIAYFLSKGGSLEIERPRVVEFAEINLAYFLNEPRPVMPRVSYERGIKNFKEVNLGITDEIAIREAERCFSCGICNECDNCLIFCPDVAISKVSKSGYVIDYDHCKGCGICVEECPREAMVMEEELKYR